MKVIKDNMETKRRQHSEEFKKEVVEYSLSSGKSVITAVISYL
jgi:transposase-like protein